MRSSLFLSKLNSKVFIEKMSIAQEEKVEELIGYQRFLAAFKMADPEKDFPVILKVFWEMLDEKDKDKILALEFVRYEGLEKIPYKPADEVDLLKNVISGVNELTELATAMMKTIQSAMPDEAKNDKKKVTMG